MVYSNKFVMAVLVNGRVQEELANGTVKLPFGAEYSLRFRNKNDRRAVVKIYVDGENVSGGGYVIPANDHIDIKRHHDKDRAFKFVELDSPEAVDAGKNGPNADKTKGVIEARFYLEKPEPTYFSAPYYPPVRHEEHHHHHHYHPPVSPPPYYPRPSPIWYGLRGQVEGQDRSATLGSYSSGDTQSQNMSVSGSSGGARVGLAGMRRGLMTRKSVKASPALETSVTASDFDGDVTCDFDPSEKMLSLKDGCTVEGGSTGQNFGTVHIKLEDTYTTLKVFLQGYEDAEVEVAEAPKKGRKVKSGAADELEAENERLRKELAELENAKLKAELEKAKAGAKKPRKKAAPKKKKKDEDFTDRDGDPSGK